MVLSGIINNCTLHWHSKFTKKCPKNIQNDLNVYKTKKNVGKIDVFCKRNGNSSVNDSQ